MRFDLESWRFGERAEERIKWEGRGKERRGEGIVICSFVWMLQ